MHNKSNIDDLRSHLFEALTRLNDPNANLEKEINRAKAIAEVGSVIVNSAKVEVDYVKISGGGTGSGFIPHSKRIGKEQKQIGSDDNNG